MFTRILFIWTLLVRSANTTVRTLTFFSPWKVWQGSRSFIGPDVGSRGVLKQASLPDTGPFLLLRTVVSQHHCIALPLLEVVPVIGCMMAHTRKIKS